MSQKNILITGAGGAVGSHILWLKNQIDGNVLGTKRNGKNRISPNIVFVDLLDQESLKKLPENINSVIHCAAVTPLKAKSIQDFEKNILLAKNISEYSSRTSIDQIIMISSGSVYSSTPPGVQHLENESNTSSDPYGKSMKCAEDLILKAKKVNSKIILRLFYPYGFEGVYAQSSVIGKFAMAVQNEQSIAVPNDNCQLQPFFIDDLLPLLNKLMTSHMTGVVNLAGPNKIGLRELIKHISYLLNSPLQLIKDRNIPLPLLADTAYLKEIYNNPLTNIEAALQKALNRFI